MLSGDREMDQKTIKIAYNKLVDELKNTYPALEKLTDKGSCFGLSFYYAMHSPNERLVSFIPYLKFLYSLKRRTTFANVISQIKTTNRVLILDGQSKLDFISIEGIIKFINIINTIQTRKFSLFPAVWKKNYAFVCHQNHLAYALSLIFAYNKNKKFLFSLPGHLFCVEHTSQGFYLFEPNHINDYAIFPLIKTVNELSEQILENCKNKIGNNGLVSFQLLYVSFKNIYPYKGILEQNNKLIQSLNVYHSWLDLIEGRISYIDFFSLLSDKIDELEEQNIYHPLLTQLQTFKTSINYYVKRELIILNHLLNLSLPYLFNFVFIDNYSLLIHTSGMNYISLIKQLIALKLDVNQQIPNRFMFPLYLAAQNNFYDLARLLINHSANVNQSLFTDETPLYIATSQEHFRIVDLLIRNHAIVNFKTLNGATALHLTARIGNGKLANLLIANHADVNAKMHKTGTAPLHIALQYGHVEILKLLLANDVEISDYQLKKTIIQHAYQQLLKEELLKYEHANLSLLKKWTRKATNLDIHFLQYGYEILTFAEQLIVSACCFKSSQLLKMVVTKSPQINNEFNIDKILLLTVPPHAFNQTKTWITNHLNFITPPSLTNTNAILTKTPSTLFYKKRTLNDQDQPNIHNLEVMVANKKLCL